MVSLNKIYTVFMALLAVVLLFIFQPIKVKALWNTDNVFSGIYYNATFLQDVNRSLTQNLKDFGGRIIASSPQKVTFQLANPLNAQLFMKPIIARQLQGKLNKSKVRIKYKNFKTVSIYTSEKGQKKHVFDITQQTAEKIDLGQFINDAPIFYLDITTGDDKQGHLLGSENVVGGIELYQIKPQLGTEQPNIPLLAFLIIAPLIWLWLFRVVLNLSLPAVLGLTLACLVFIHIIMVLNHTLGENLLWAMTIISVLMQVFKGLFEKQPIPVAPFFWMVLLLAINLRWNEILVQGAIPLHFFEMASEYYQAAYGMELFTETGFWSATYRHEPMFPFLMMVCGSIFGLTAFHMFYVSLFFSVLLFVFVYWMALWVFESEWLSFFAASLVAINKLLIYDSALRMPGALLACIFILFLVLILSEIKSWFVRGFLRGVLALVWALTHLGAGISIVLLMIVDTAYQVMREDQTANWKESMKGLLCSFCILVCGLMPYIFQSYVQHQQMFAESSRYVSRVANLEFSDHHGFPSTVEVVLMGEDAPLYRQVSPNEYFFQFHNAWKFLGASLIGYLAIGMDTMGNLLSFSTGQNVVGVLVDHLFALENYLSLIGIFALEVILLLSICVFLLLKHRRYLILLIACLVVIFPHSFFYGLFLVKGLSNIQLLLDIQIFVYVLPVFALILADLLGVLVEQRKVFFK